VSDDLARAVTFTAIASGLTDEQGRPWPADRATARRTDCPHRRRRFAPLPSDELLVAIACTACGLRLEDPIRRCPGEVAGRRCRLPIGHPGDCRPPSEPRS
jgi:hypothetical protein